MDRVISLNVGGKRYDVSHSTLLGDPTSKLANIFGNESELAKLQHDATGAFFLDRDGKSFRYVLNYLRCRKQQAQGPIEHLSYVLPSNAGELGHVVLEAEAYGLTELKILASEMLKGYAMDLQTCGSQEGYYALLGLPEGYGTTTYYTTVAERCVTEKVQNMGFS